MRRVLLITLLACLLQKSALETALLKKIVALNKAPDLKPLKKHLGFYEDTYLNFTELTTKYGYPSEEHIVTTEDGYILTIFRLLTKCNEPKGYPVLMMHGIIDSSDGFIIPTPKKAIGYILSNNCYDVWLLNNRGNVYSRKHTRLDPDRDASYWNFSFEEIGYYDVPAVIDHVLMKTQKKKVFYIGHSQGTTNFLVTTSLRPEYNEKLQLAVLIAPVAWMGHIRSPIPKIAANFEKEIVGILRALNIVDLAPKNDIVPHQLLEFLCQVVPLEVCGTVGFISVGDVIGVIPAQTLRVLYGHILVGVAAKTVQHYAQLITSKRFQRFDDGRDANLQKYGAIRPPLYNVSRVTTPTLLICAKHDWLSELKDVDILRSKLPNVVESYVVADPNWSHNSHIWGAKAPEYVFPKILQHLQEYSNR
ncbi:lipase 3-like [Aricia agestis]|uniref:lipase 3-like n=1 Tax=Aricia agestis TaxID=91739 RepID=UPI001C20750E|nr:lipase 3-like [Aricia agestis]